MRILGANQQNDIITSEYLEEVHHLQYPSHAFTVLTARSEEECARYSRTSINSLRSLISGNKNKQRVGGYVVGTFQPPGEPLKQVLVPLSVGRELFSIGDLSIQPSLRPKTFQKRWGKTFDGTAPTIT